MNASSSASQHGRLSSDRVVPVAGTPFDVSRPVDNSTSSQLQCLQGMFHDNMSAFDAKLTHITQVVLSLQLSTLVRRLCWKRTTRGR